MQTYNVGILKPRNIKELEYLLQQKGIWFDYTKQFDLV